MRLFFVKIEGPRGTLYEGGTYNLQMYVPTDYPFKPPKCIFTTELYHVNTDDLGK